MSSHKIILKMKRFLKRIRKFELFVAVSVLVYLSYVLIVFLFSSSAHQKNDKLFEILHISSTPIAPAATTLVTIKNELQQQYLYNDQEDTTEEAKCSVTVAIILCEDDHYLTTKKSFSNNKFKNSSSANKTATATAIDPSLQFTTSYPKRQKLAKDFSRQINQTLVLLKSIAILTAQEQYAEPPSFTKAQKSCVEILILSDKLNHYKTIKEEMRKTWSEKFLNLVKVTHVPVRYPPGSAWMKNLFRPCATLRLFLAELLPRKWESILYLDTDILFFQSVQSLWSQFKKFDIEDDNKDDEEENENYEDNYAINANDSVREMSSDKVTVKRKVAAMAPCLVHYGTSANSIPYFGDSGLNAGIMLMNLTRMRTSQWTNKVRMVTTMFQDKIKLADQDILNIYFHFFPEELHVLSCDWNFRPFQCRAGSYCQDSELSQGISALHGNALSFTPQGPEPLFRAVFQTFQRLKLDKKFQLRRFVQELESALVKADENTRKYNSQCKQFGEFDVLLLNRLYNLIER